MGLAFVRDRPSQNASVGVGSQVNRGSRFWIPITSAEASPESLT